MIGYEQIRINKGKTILVIGDSCIDEFIYGSVDRLAPEAPVAVIVPQRKDVNRGMAANVYDNIKSLDTNAVLITNWETPTKTRYVDSRTKNIMLRVDSYDKVNRITQQTLDEIRSNSDKYDAIVVSDYNKGYLEGDDIEYLCSLNQNVFIDTKKHLGKWCTNAKVIKLNEIEYNNNKMYINNLGVSDKLLITLGGKGCKWKGKVFSVKDVETKNISGAGDTFVASLVVKYLETNDMEQSINFAQDCATIVVQKHNVVSVGEYYGKNQLL